MNFYSSKMHHSEYLTSLGLSQQVAASQHRGDQSSHSMTQLGVDCCYPQENWNYNGLTPMKQIEGT